MGYTNLLTVDYERRMFPAVAHFSGQISIIEMTIVLGNKHDLQSDVVRR
jgi:hypothetical protein